MNLVLNKYTLVLLILTSTFLTKAQVSNFPHGENQRASVSQNMGLVKIEVIYNSPDVTSPDGKDRGNQIWGQLIKDGMTKERWMENKGDTTTLKPYRMGANENTIIKVSHDILVEGKKLPAGTYSLFGIPNKDEWTIIFSTFKKMYLIFKFIVISFLIIDFNISTHAEVLSFSESRIDNDLEIIIHMPPKSFVILNVVNKYFIVDGVRFINNSPDSAYISNVVAKADGYQEIAHIIWDKSYLGRLYFQQFLLVEDTKEVRFKYQDRKLILESNNLLDYSILYNTYKDFKFKVINSKTDNKAQYQKELKKIYQGFKDKYTKEEGGDIHLKLNEFRYQRVFQDIFPQNVESENYIKRITQSPFVIYDITWMMYTYIKNNYDKINFNRLNTINHSADFIDYFSIGANFFLGKKENKGNKKYKPLLDWFMRSDLSKTDSVYFRERLLALDKIEFKERLDALQFRDPNNINIGLKEVMEMYPSDFYLLDLWATWCGPCIKGFEEIKKLDLPQNLMIIKISVDKKDAESKWREMSKELNLKNSYVLPQDYFPTQAFIDYLELNSVPRFILMDREMMVIHEDFYQPHEPQFIKELKAVCIGK